MSKKIFLILVLSLLTVQGGLAETAEYYLERIAIHTRSMESQLETPKLGSQFQGDLRRLEADLEKWKSTFLDEEDLKDVRERLDDHSHMLRASALTISLDSDQKTALGLLVLEIENGSQNLRPDSSAQTTTIRIPYELPSRERDNVVYASDWGAPGLNVGGLGGLCEPGGVDPWGPYFGRDFYPNSAPLWW